MQCCVKNSHTCENRVRVQVHTRTRTCSKKSFFKSTRTRTRAVF